MNLRALVRAASLVILVLGSSSTMAISAFDKGMEALGAGNFAEAYCYWKPLALQGDIESQYNLAWLYANGNGMNVDTKTAVHWWKKAADKGHQDARFAVGMAYITGEGIKPDADEALSWFILAANSGMADARDIIGQLSADPRYKVVELHPEILEYPWFGRTAKVTAKTLNVRNKPSTKAKVIAQISQGDSVRVVSEANDWLMIYLKSSRQKGWVFKPLVKFLE